MEPAVGGAVGTIIGGKGGDGTATMGGGEDDCAIIPDCAIVAAAMANIEIMYFPLTRTG